MISGNFRKGKACKHGGVCMNESFYPFEMFCDCTGTGYHGDLCEIDDCINCSGNQTCTEIDLLAPNNATCECKGLFATMLDSLSTLTAHLYSRNRDFTFLILRSYSHLRSL